MAQRSYRVAMHYQFFSLQNVFSMAVIENGWCFFPWSSKGITGKMPEPWLPPRGKLEKKAVFFTALWRWNNHKLEQSLFNKMPTVISHLIKRNCFISVFQEGCRPSCPQLSKIFYNHSTLYDKFCKLNLQRWSCVRCVVQNALNTW